ncbi:MAG: arginine decarboxylase, pyruvoyl-dependent [Peptococcaceae bacterium]
MLPTPKKFFLTCAAAEGKNHLTAFDNALLKARIGNVNIIRVSSILPPGTVYEPGLSIPPGSLVPTAYGYIISDVPGEIISAAVGVGFSRDTFGLIMEYAGKCLEEEARQKVESMLREAFAARDMSLSEIMIVSCVHQTEKIGCSLAAVPMWY